MSNDTGIDTEASPSPAEPSMVQENVNELSSSTDAPGSQETQNDENNVAQVEPAPKDENLENIICSDAEFLSKIHALHCPFTWNPEEHLKTYRRDEIEDLMGADEMFEETSFKLRRFVIHLILAYNNYCKRMLEDSIRNLDEMEKMLLASLKNKSRDVYFVSINDALFHILQSCRVVMLNAINRKEKALQILRKITPYDEMNNCNKAGIWAVRANLYVEFGYDGVKAAVEYMKNATSIDDKNPYWYFMKGVYLGRLRRLESGFAIPSVDEIASLEYAMKLKEDASFFAFAAEVYVETADRTLKQYQELFHDKCQEKQKNEIMKKSVLLNKHAAMLFKKSIELNPTCAHLLFRCGKGLLKLPPPYQDVDLGRKFIEEGLSLSYESSYGNHAMAMYYEKYEENYEVAKKYLKKAVEHKNFGADLDLIRIRYLENRDLDFVLNSLKKLFEIYPDGVKHRKILAEIISYYLFLRYDLSQAISYMKKLLYLIGDNDEIINTFKSGISRQKSPCSLLAVLLSDITNRSNKETLTSEEKEQCKSFLNKLCCQNFTLPSPSTENLREKIAREINAHFRSIDGRVAKRQSTSPTKIEPVEKEYDPVSNRFNKEYAKKYYIDKGEEKSVTKTMVDDFFSKYAAEVEAKTKDKCEPSTSSKSNKPKNNQGEPMNPTVQKLFNNMKKSKRLHLNHSDSNSESSDKEKDSVYRLAKQFERRFNTSPEKEHDGNSRSGSNSCHRAHSNNVERDKRSLSRESRSKPSDQKRSSSRESRRSCKPSNRDRSTSRESRKSTKLTHRNRSASRESYRSTRRNRSTSRDTHKSRKNRSRSRDERKSHIRDRYGHRHERSDSEESRRSSKTTHRNRYQKKHHKYYESTSSSGSSYSSFYSDSDSSSDHRRYRRSKKVSPMRRKEESYRKRNRNEKYKHRRSSKEYIESDTVDNSYSDSASHTDESYKSRRSTRDKNRRTKRSVSRSTSRSNAKKYSSAETLKDTNTSSDIENKRSHSRASARSRKGSTYDDSRRKHRYNDGRNRVKRSTSRESHRSNRSSRKHYASSRRNDSSVEKYVSDRNAGDKESTKSDEVNRHSDPDRDHSGAESDIIF